MGRITDYFSTQGVALAVQTKQQMLTFDKQFEALESEVVSLKAENLKLRAEVNPLKREVERLKNESEQQSSGVQNPMGYVCDHCGSSRLKRTGNRPDPTFAALGVKQAVFNCLECGKESAFTPRDG